MEKLTKQQMALLAGGKMKPCKWTDPDTGEEISGFCDEIGLAM